MVSLFSTLCFKCCLFIMYSLEVNNVLAIRCYVCGNDESEVSCKDFDNAEKFVAECGAQYQACRIAKRETENHVFSRSCAKTKLEDCKVANNIEYCYCSKNLCNYVLNPISDDEDLVEASGDFSSEPTAHIDDKNVFDSEILVDENSTPAKTSDDTSGCVLYYSPRTSRMSLYAFIFLILFLNAK